MNDTGSLWTLPPLEEDTLPSASEIVVALRLAEQHRRCLQYIPAWGWRVWTGTHWRRDDMLQAFDRARDICREEVGRPHSEKDRKDIASAKSVAAVGPGAVE
jgi:putative DNA primase/helicase